MGRALSATLCASGTASLRINPESNTVPAGRPPSFDHDGDVVGRVNLNIAWLNLVRHLYVSFDELQIKRPHSLYGLVQDALLDVPNLLEILNGLR